MDAIELLTRDHLEVERLFAQLGNKDADQQQILGQIVKQLSMHDSVEKRVFYPEIEEYVPGGQALAERALDEHEELEQLVASVDGCDPSDPGVADRLDLLMTAVRRHVNEEETEIFPALVHASEPGQLARLGAKLESAKAWAPTHPHPHARRSGPLAGPLNAAASVIDMARDNRAESQDTPVVDSIKGEDKEPLADPSAGDKPPVDLMSWPEVYRDEETRQAQSSSENEETGEEKAQGAESAPDGQPTPAVREWVALARSEEPAPTLSTQQVADPSRPLADSSAHPVAARMEATAPTQAVEPSASVAEPSASVAEPSEPEQSGVSVTEPSELSVAELVSQLAEQTAQLARQELALARLEVRETGRRAGLGLGALSLAGVVGLYGGAALVAGIILLIAVPLTGWAAALIVGVGLSLLAGMVALAGGRQVRKAIRPRAASLLTTVETDLDKVTDAISPTKAGA